MKNVLVIGASGSLGRVVAEFLEKQEDVNLTLFARRKSGVLQKDGVKVVLGDALNFQDIKEAVKGQDIVYINLAGDLKTMGENIVKAMEQEGVKRVIAICSIGIYDTPLKPVLKPYRALADVIESSNLEYTILRPDWFTNGNEIDYMLTKKGEKECGNALSRKSIASFVCSLVEQPTLHVRENLGISRP